MPYMAMRFIFGLLGFSLAFSTTGAQTNNDTLAKEGKKVSLAGYAEHKELTQSGTHLLPQEGDYDSSGVFTLSGYVSTYFAYFTDTSGHDGFQKFPTVSPRNKEFAVNLAQLSAKYQATNMRGIITFHYGDIPSSSWSPRFNNLQEANAGFKLWKNLWVDMGFFRGHIGLEGIQPRENSCMSLAITTNFEPYYMSGIKFTWYMNKQLTLQSCIMNGFNTFVETNKSKAFGFSCNYLPVSPVSLTYNFYTCDERTDYTLLAQQRYYHNLCGTYKSNKTTFGADFFFCSQQNTSLKGLSNNTAYALSGHLSAKYFFVNRLALYGRVEHFQDADEVLTGPILNQHQVLTGINLWGATLGLEVKAIPNSYIRVEARQLNAKQDEKIFSYNNTSSNKRLETILAIGTWF